MEIFYSKSFKKDFLNLPDNIRKLATKKLELFGDNYRHPSLKTKKMEGFENVWEGRITISYRFTFKIESNVCILRRIGTHDILKKEK